METSYFKVSFIQLENYTLDVDIVKIIPEEMARCFKVVALEKWVSILTVGMVNPEDKNTINILEGRLKCKIIPIRIEIEKWAEAINNNYLRK